MREANFWLHFWELERVRGGFPEVSRQLDWQQIQPGRFTFPIQYSKCSFKKNVKSWVGCHGSARTKSCCGLSREELWTLCFLVDFAGSDFFDCPCVSLFMRSYFLVINFFLFIFSWAFPVGCCFRVLLSCVLFGHSFFCLVFPPWLSALVPNGSPASNHLCPLVSIRSLCLPLFCLLRLFGCSLFTFGGLKLSFGQLYFVYISFKDWKYVFIWTFFKYSFFANQHLSPAPTKPNIGDSILKKSLARSRLLKQTPKTYVDKSPSAGWDKGGGRWITLFTLSFLGVEYGLCITLWWRSP